MTKIISDPTKFSEDELMGIWREDCDERFELVHEGEWTDGGKYQDIFVVFKDAETGKHYAFTVYRSGSYFSDYHYEMYDGAEEVKEQERTITIKEWVTI